MSPLPLRPSYLRIVVTTSCPLRCDYCHMEGDPWSGGPRGLDGETLSRLLEAAARCGIQKFKYLGGEPLVRRDLPEITARLRAAAPEADISVISSGVAAPERFAALFAAGLDRANLSIHGWSAESFARHGGTARGFALRQACLDRVLAEGRPVKLNYVIGTEGDNLRDLLGWAAGRPVVVNLLDDLTDEDASSGTVARQLEALRGPWERAVPEPDPHSLPTTRLHWADGLEVELKTEQLGLLAPWRACRLCPARIRCREGIFAVRLNHRGELQPCMDRPDVRLALVPILEAGGVDAVVEAWSAFIDARLRAPAR